eukprot:5718519-Amphidinium_carterae.1
MERLLSSEAAPSESDQYGALRRQTLQALLTVKEQLSRLARCSFQLTEANHDTDPHFFPCGLVAHVGCASVRDSSTTRHPHRQELVKSVLRHGRGLLPNLETE